MGVRNSGSGGVSSAKIETRFGPERQSWPGIAGAESRT
jgi:hypothetical protein